MVLKSKTKNKIAISAVSIAIVAAALICIYHFFFSTAAIKGEKLMDEYPSPNSAYTVEIWENNTDSAEAQWLDDDTVIINGRKIPNVLKDKYDFRYSKN